MVTLNKVVFEKSSYFKDGREVEYVNMYLDATIDDYRYRIPLSCSDKGELSRYFREVKNDCEGVYELTYIGE